MYNWAEWIFLEFIIVLTIVKKFVNTLYTCFLHDLTLLTLGEALSLHKGCVCFKEIFFKNNNRCNN